MPKEEDLYPRPNIVYNPKNRLFLVMVTMPRRQSTTRPRPCRTWALRWLGRRRWRGSVTQLRWLGSRASRSQSWFSESSFVASGIRCSSTSSSWSLSPALDCSCTMTQSAWIVLSPEKSKQTSWERERSCCSRLSCLTESPALFRDQL